MGWPAQRSVRGQATGTHRSPLRGSSPEFTEYRPYRQGDDPRRLDWKLLARTDRAYLRITNDRALLGTWLLMDASASMAFPEGGHDKWMQGCRVAVGLAAAALASGDPLGAAISVGGEARTLPARTRRGTLAALTALLEGVTPAGDAPLVPALTVLPPRHRVAIISDLLGSDADALRRLAAERIVAGGEVHVVHLLAREELEPPHRAISAFDAEHPEIARPLTEATRVEYVAAFTAWRAEVARGWRSAGASYTEVLTDESAERAVRRIAQGQTAAGSRPG